MWIITLIIVTLVVITFIILNLPQFGKSATGERLRRIEASPNYKDGAFRNLSETPSFTSNDNAFTTFYKMLFSKPERLRPEEIMPSVKTNLTTLNPQQDVVVWMGHSSYFMQVDGKKILVDPVLSNYASPFPWIIKAFDGTSIYTPDDIPEIDYLVITHDHWDHLDMRTLKNIHPRVKQVVTGLGVGAHLEYWGVDAAKINEFDWKDSLQFDNNIHFHATTARHFSGRGLKRNGTLWVSFVLQTPTRKIFIGGDGGYDQHFAEIGRQFGPFDLVLLEAGQYDKRWKYIHMMPEEVVQAAIDLNTRSLMPVHHSRFALAAHPWDEPVKRVKASYDSIKPTYELLLPTIGKPLMNEARTLVKKPAKPQQLIINN